MGYATANFGLQSGSNVTTQVHTEFGARVTGGNAGPLLTDGSSQNVVFEVTGQNFADLGENLGLLALYLPAGAVIRRAVVQVITVFALTGTTPKFWLGTSTSESTNGVSISQAQIQAQGFYDITATQTGTWAAATPLAARTLVGGAIAGGGALSTTGEMRITLTYETIGLKTV